MRTIIINATAAKTGGAETIIDTFIEYLEKKKLNERFIVLSPKEYRSTNPNIVSVKKETNAWQTFVFTTLTVYYYCLKYRAFKIISFNNLNLLLPLVKRTTYFHQLKDFKPEYSNIRKKVYFIVIRHFLNTTEFIVQSKIVKDLFVARFRVKHDLVKVAWPGFNIPAEIHIEKKISDFVETTLSYHDKVGLCPISYSGIHKNLDSIFFYDKFFLLNNISIISLLEAPPKSNLDAFSFIGKVDRSTLFYIYNKVDFIIFPSITETVGLPIFEFLQTGKPTFVHEADYSKHFFERFNKPKNLILYNDLNFEDQFSSRIDTSFAKEYDYSKGEWAKLISA